MAALSLVMVPQQEGGYDYIRRKEESPKIALEHGALLVNLIGLANGAKQFSLDHVDMPQGGSVPAQFLPESEEGSYVIMEGKGKLVINGKSRIVTPGDFIKIDAGSVHEISNENDETLVFYRVNAPASTPRVSEVIEKGVLMGSHDDREITVRRLEDCDKFVSDTGEIIRELLGKVRRETERHSWAHVALPKGKCSLKHYHPVAEEGYIITKGEGRLEINGQTKIVKPGDVIHIPANHIHQIFNDRDDIFELIVACAPAWTPEGSEEVTA